MHEQHNITVGPLPPKEQLESTRWITLLFQFQFHLNPPPCACVVQILNISGLCVRCGKRDAGEDRGGGASDGNSTTEECAVRSRTTCHTSGKCYSALGGRAVGTQVATHTDNRKKGEGGMATAALRGRLSSAINLHLIAFACAALRQPRLASVIGLVVSFTTVVPCSVRLRADLFQRSEGEGRGKESRLGSGNWGRWADGEAAY